ncbi:hypothetical protein DFH09DRAFT_1325090 [Mycena vulgaris]|nr:hypothetical protein DFH09DRAFT_1325090 [Mycena vulgaris]
MQNNDEKYEPRAKTGPEEDTRRFYSSTVGHADWKDTHTLPVLLTTRTTPALSPANHGHDDDEERRHAGAESTPSNRTKTISKNPTTRMAAATGYKARTLRSYPQLPHSDPDVLIATYHLVAAAARAPVPASWEFIVSGSPAFNSVALIARPHPTDDNAHREKTRTEKTRTGAAQGPPSPLRQFFTYVCLPCRVNARRSAHELNAGQRTAPAPRLGTIVLCKVQDGGERSASVECAAGGMPRRVALALRPPCRGAREPNPPPPPNPPPGPGKAEARARWAGGTGGGAFAPAESLVRAAVVGFVELREGTVQHLLVVAGKEKHEQLLSCGL